MVTRWMSIGTAVTLMASGLAFADDWSSFRGANRQGLSLEKNLLATWPAGGPSLVWSVTGLGQGYSSPCVVADKVYVSGKTGGQGYLYAFDAKGEPVWKVGYGAETEGAGYPGSRSTPTFDSDRLYLISGLGELSCFEAKSGERVWHVNILERFGGKNPRWGISESVLIDGDNVICSPGSRAAVVALNKKTGEVVWTCEGIDHDGASYCSPVLVPRKGRNLIINVLNGAIGGIDAGNGKLLWQHPFHSRFGVMAVSPVVNGDMVFTSCAFTGSILLELSADGSQAMVKWRKKSFDNGHGGVVRIGEHLYGSSYTNPKDHWVCAELSTGNVTYEKAGLGKGSLIAAEGLLYCYSEKGTLSLVRPNPTKYEVISSFAVSEGSGPHWAHPAISNGRLYLRHGDVLMCYDIRAR